MVVSRFLYKLSRTLRSRHLSQSSCSHPFLKLSFSYQNESIKYFSSTYPKGTKFMVGAVGTYMIEELKAFTSPHRVETTPNISFNFGHCRNE